MIPLYSTEQEKLISLSGDTTHFYEVFSPDHEQMSFDEVQQSFLRLENDLKLSGFGKFFKLYFLDGKLFLNASEKSALGDSFFRPNQRPLEVFFNGGLHSDVDFFDTFLTVNGKYLRVLSLKKAPFEVNPNDLYELCDGLFSYVLHLQRFEAQTAKRKLNMRRKVHFSGLFKSLKDIESENAYSESEALLEGVTKGETSLFRMECFFLVDALSLGELEERTNTLLERLKLIDAKVIIESKALPTIYKSMIPGVPPLFRREIEVPSDYLSYLIPYQRDFLMDEGLSLTSLKGHTLKFNLFERTGHNFNLLITGSSGQGKSMMANKLLFEEIEQGAKALCLDLGNSFRKNALYHEGVIFSEQFNPLQFKNPRYLKEFIIACIDEELSRKEEGRLFETIENALNESPENFNELISLLEKDFEGIRHYFTELKPYFCDEIRPEANFTYCDFSNYPEAIKAPLIIYLIEYFKNLHGKKVFVFDECWHLLSKNADYIAECFRTFRKHNASAVAISQNLDDFSQFQLGRVIIQNTYYKFFFRQGLQSSEFVDEDLSERVANAQSVKGQYSQFVIHSEQIKKIVCYYPTPLEYELFTSDKQDMNYFDLFMSEQGRFLPFQRAIENYVEIKYPQGSYDENSF